MEKVRLDFSHPWSDFLFLYKVPNEKWNEFYQQYGIFFYSLSTHEETKTNAMRWIIQNRGPASEVSGSIKTLKS
jgi:hypothetical protein